MTQRNGYTHPFIFSILKRLVIYLLPMLVLFNAASACADTNEKAIRLVTNFVSGEFNGEVDLRLDFAKFSSHTTEAKEAKKHPGWLLGRVISLTGSPLVVVGSYEVDPVVADGCIVQVKYEVLATTTGDGALERRLIPMQHYQEVVKYRVVIDATGERIIDPPIPRISLAAMLDEYSGEVEQAKAIARLPQASNSQKKVFELLVSEFGVLAKISKVKSEAKGF